MKVLQTKCLLEHQTLCETPHSIRIGCLLVLLTIFQQTGYLHAGVGQVCRWLTGLSLCSSLIEQIPNFTVHKRKTLNHVSSLPPHSEQPYTYFPFRRVIVQNSLKHGEAFRTSTKVATSLTLILKEQHLHAIKWEGLAEAVRHRVLLLLENFSDLWTKKANHILWIQWNTCVFFNVPGKVMYFIPPGGH